MGALNLIDESKSLPVEANNSTIKLHLPVEGKEKIVMIDESKSLPVEAKKKDFKPIAVARNNKYFCMT